MGYLENNINALPKIKCVLCILFSLFFCFVFGQEQKTTFIDSVTQKAYNNARLNSESSIENAHQALSSSKSIHYSKGIADASLALGAAYFAKYNPDDSANYYYNQALNIYNQFENFTGLARTCYGLSYLYNFKSQPQKALEFGNLSVEYFEKAESQREVIAALEAVIFLEKQEDNYDKALELSDKAIEIARLQSDTLQWANALNNKGNILKDMFLFSPAFDAYFEAFNLWELTNDTSGLAIAYGSIANAWYFEGDYNKSLEFNFKKLSITKKTGDLWETNKTMNNIALSYNHLNKQDSALLYIKQSSAIAIKMNYPEGLSNTYDILASVFLRLENTDSSLFYISEAISIAEKTNSPNLAKYQLNKIVAFNQQKKYNNALNVAKEVYNLAKQKGDNYILRDVSFLLSEIYYYLGQRDLAYPFLTEYLELNDSITNIDYIRKVTRLDIQHEYESKQRKTQYEIDLLAKNNQLKTERLQKARILLIAIILLSIAGAGISFLIIKNKKQRIEHMNLEIRNYLYQLEKIKAISRNENHISQLAKSYGLTHRETEIMELIATGIGNEEIADKLFVSKNTIKFHIKNIFIKLDVRNRVQALQKIAS